MCSGAVKIRYRSLTAYLETVETTVCASEASWQAVVTSACDVSWTCIGDAIEAGDTVCAAAFSCQSDSANCPLLQGALGDIIHFSCKEFADTCSPYSDSDSREKTNCLRDLADANSFRSFLQNKDLFDFGTAATDPDGQDDTFTDLWVFDCEASTEEEGAEGDGEPVELDPDWVPSSFASVDLDAACEEEGDEEEEETGVSLGQDVNVDIMCRGYQMAFYCTQFKSDGSCDSDQRAMIGNLELDKMAYLCDPTSGAIATSCQITKVRTCQVKSVAALSAQFAADEDLDIQVFSQTIRGCQSRIPIGGCEEREKFLLHLRVQQMLVSLKKYTSNAAGNLSTNSVCRICLRSRSDLQ